MRVFVDSNVAMYAAGSPHPNKQPSLDFLAASHAGSIHAVTSTEVLQEILHRYQRLNVPEIGRSVYGLLVQICAEVLPVTIADTDLTVELLEVTPGSVRDALHVAVMQNNEVERVASFDRGFDQFGVVRHVLK